VEQGPKRKLTTILHADVAGYSRLMRSDEEGTHRILQAVRREFDRLVAAHEGRIFGTAGDSVIAEFASPVEAVRCATEIQKAVQLVEVDLPEDGKLIFRIGLNLGDVIVEGDNLIGDGVNVAQRLETLAEPGGICISNSVFEQVKTKLKLNYKDIGEQHVKNIADPVRAYRVAVEQDQGRPSARHRPSRHLVGIMAATLLLLAALIAAVEYAPSLLNPPGRSLETSTSDRPTIAVLPFANLSGDPGQDYFSDGVTEDIITALGRFPDLSVIAREAVQQYKGKPLQPGELSQELGIRYQLEGSVRKEGDRVRVTSRLSDARTGVELWSDRYEGELKDVFAVQDDITRSVAGALAIKLAGLEKQRTFAKPTDSLQAYDYVLRGRDLIAHNTRSGNIQARDLLERAIQLDPGYAAAYVALGWVRLKSAVYGWTEFAGEALNQAEALAQKAIDLDETSSEAHQLLSSVYLNSGKYDLALSEDSRALALNPSDAEAYAGRGSELVFLGRPKEALQDFEIALRLNPGFGSGRMFPVGWAYYLEERYDEAARAFESGLRLDPNDYFIHAGLAATYAELNRPEQAARAAAAVRSTWPFFSVAAFASQFQGESNRAHIAEGLRKAGLSE
jgi:TolB-like protein/class 3 adenylate cyclase/Flp pilus assembly protein TadD